MTSYKLAAFDMDGTLLNSHHQFSARTEEMLRKLLEKGIHIVLVSGRPYTVIRRMVDKLPMFCGPNALPQSSTNKTRFICAGSNGAVVYDEDRTCLLSKTRSPKMCAALYDVLSSDPEVNLNVFVTVTPEDRATPGYVNLSDREGDPAADKWLCRFADPVDTKMFEEGGIVQEVCTDMSRWPSHNVNGMFFGVYDPDKVQLLRSEVERRIAAIEKETNGKDSAILGQNAPDRYGIIPNSMNKATAIRFISEKLGFSIADCVAFGDGMNDAQMLKEVGKGFVMGNANASLRQVLPHHEVIGTNDEDAVAETCEKLFQL